jgi:hypothetical protein
VIARYLYFEPAAPRSQRSEIPVELEEIVLRLLKKEPRARYNTAADFVRAIDQLSGSPSPAVRPSKPLATEFVATLPVVRDTTLNGAASSSEVSRKPDSRSRFAIVAGAATFAVVFLAVVILFRAHGNGEIATNSAAAALAAGQKGRENPPVQATPAPPASTPPPVAAGAVARPAAGSPDPVTDTPRPADVHRDGSSVAGAAPSAVAPTASPETAAAAREAPPPEPRKPPAAKPAGHRKPRDGTRPAPVPADPPDPYAFPKWNKTLQPVGAGTQPDSASPSVAAPPNEPPGGAAVAKPSHPPGPPAPGAAPAPLEPECTRTSFAAVLDAKTPSPAAVKNALTLLGRCKPRMDPVLHDDIHRQLIDKS